MIRTLFTIAIIGLAQYSVAQEAILSIFHADVNNGKVVLSWTINAGSTCNGVEIYHALDSTGFIEIGDIPGVCGDINSPKTYTFTHYEPTPNTTNYYRLGLGGQETSWIVGVEVIDLSNNDYILRPNPASEFVELLFSNDNHQDVTLDVYDFNGTLCGTYVTQQSIISLNVSNWEKGIYVFELKNPVRKSQIIGKLLVVH